MKCFSLAQYIFVYTFEVSTLYNPLHTQHLDICAHWFVEPYDSVSWVNWIFARLYTQYNHKRNIKRVRANERANERTNKRATGWWHNVVIFEVFVCFHMWIWLWLCLCAHLCELDEVCFSFVCASQLHKENTYKNWISSI